MYTLPTFFMAFCHKRVLNAIKQWLVKLDFLTVRDKLFSTLENYMSIRYLRTLVDERLTIA